MTKLLVDVSDTMLHKLYGKYRGVVRSVDDPENLGRIQVEVPEALRGVVSPWATPCVPYAGDNVGSYLIPPVGSGVWVEFEKGDPSLPIWTGGWWASGEIPKNESGTEATPPLKIIRTEKGLQLSFDDDGERITISDENGHNLVKVMVQQGQIRIEAQTKVIVEAPQIELVDGASHPLVFGDDLLQYLNQIVNLYLSHTHMGETVVGIPVTPAPPTPPFPPPSPSMLSLKVKTG